MTCAQCQHENRTGARFCDNCGAPLPRACSSCGTPLRPAAKFCDECGQPVAAAEAAARPARAVQAPTGY
ncbi:MAG TPA: zinc-ribbon domain-containing protein, partial [Methylomirabilota bacterium]|nr:zinc-ribbon domain-containing protein [Methylomirabilota bacterium]